MASSYTRFLKFQREQNGIFPPTLAMALLGVSRARLNQLATSKQVDYIRCSGRRYYGVKSLNNYKFWRSAHRAFIRDNLNAK